MSIAEIKRKYHKKISPLDLEILISHAIGKSREFVLANPEYIIPKTQSLKLETFIKRRIKNEPVAYITGHKEFYGLNFEVNKSTLIPRPETELIVDLLRSMLRSKKLRNDTIIADIGTGSGNIIISIASQLKNKELRIKNYDLYGIDISKDALKVAKNNAKKHGVDNPPAGGIKFIHGNLLEPLSKKLMKLKANKLIITANLPYLSDKIYSESPDDVKKYEPKTALYSDNDGLAHYEKLLKQVKEALASCHLYHVTCYFEISPEQKPKLDKVIKIIFPKARIKFHKDLARKWRICEIKI